jgi:thiol-disulfide isomerase/thioredoxin
LRLNQIVILGLGLSLGIVLGATILISSPKKTGGQSPPTVGRPVPDFSLVLLNGEKISKDSLAGRPYLINFWATWCPPCKEEMPLIEKIHVNHPDSIFVVGVNVDEGEQIVEKFIQDMNITLSVGIDRGGGISRAFFARSLPITYFVDSEGIIRAQLLGALTEATAETYLNAVGVSP